ncbi:DUF1430 domain-containing protein [Enterococcus sp. RIT-PI-f]|uniref:DUF1430 domain-containing protein n=1 Tax=Enterococcus sp. RIT-PI-f TaxID=1690244 RepID=UPI0035648FBA
MKIKRFFIFFSTLITMGFMIWTLVNSPDQLTFATYSFIYVKDEKVDAVEKKVVNDSLDSFSNENEVLIVKRIIQPTKEGHAFVYQKYGFGDLPDNFPEASEEIQNISSVFSQYLIIQGELDEQKLADKFSELGYHVEVFEKESVFEIVIAFFVGATLLALLILVFTFTALTLVLRIKDLRFAGIRLISGETIWIIIFRNLKSDFVDLIGAVSLSMLVGFGVLIWIGLAQMRIVMLLFSGLIIYLLLLSVISILFSSIYFFSLKKTNLINIIKGKLPLHQLLGIILFCQFLAIVTIGWGFSRIPLLTDAYQQQQTATREWDAHEHLVNISFNIGKEINSKEAFDEESKLWFPFIQEEIEFHGALLVNHNLLNYLTSDVDLEGNRLSDYVPLGNTLFVTPNYLEKQNISVDKALEMQLNNLKQGQFGLLMPDKLKHHSEDYQKLYENFMSVYSYEDDSADAKQLFETSAIVGYLPNSQSRFIYNHTAISSQQFLFDPILVIVTPESLGDTFSSRMFWMNVINDYFYLSDYDQAVRRLKEMDLFSSVATVSNSRQLYYEQSSRLRIELIMVIASTIIGVATSILLFNSMNLLYFEEFRRDIFIKRLSGLRFWEIHRNYLSTQLMVILFGFSLTVFITGNLWTSVFAGGFFCANAILVLYLQMKSENKLAISVLKGK